MYTQIPDWTKPLKNKTRSPKFVPLPRYMYEIHLVEGPFSIFNTSNIIWKNNLTLNTEIWVLVPIFYQTECKKWDSIYDSKFMNLNTCSVNFISVYNKKSTWSANQISIQATHVTHIYFLVNCIEQETIWKLMNNIVTRIWIIILMNHKVRHTNLDEYCISDLLHIHLITDFWKMIFDN